MIVDSHQHFWQVGGFDYPWMSPKLGVLYRDYLPEMLEPILNECGVAKTIVVQADNTLAETDWLLSLAEQHPFIAGVVGWVDLVDPRMAEDLIVFKANPKFKGVRHLVESEPEDDWLAQPEVIRGLQTLEQNDVACDLLVHTRHLKHVKTVADACPRLRLVVDHMAKPPIGNGSRREITEWAAALRAVGFLAPLSQERDQAREARGDEAECEVGHHELRGEVVTFEEFGGGFNFEFRIKN